MLVLTHRQSWQESFANFQRRIAGFTAPVRNVAQTSYYYVVQSWVNLNEGRATCYKLVGCFTAVYLLSVFPFTRSLAIRLFSHDPLSGSTITLLTSQFGHANLLHLALNSYCFIGFGEFCHYTCTNGVILTRLCRRGRLELFQSPTNKYTRKSRRSFQSIPLFGISCCRYVCDLFLNIWELNLFGTAGTFSGLVSHLVATRYQLPRLVSALTKGAADAIPPTTRFLPRSLGASGAVYASVVVAALAFPHASLQIALLPFFQFSIATGVCSLVALDVVGLIRGWRYVSTDFSSIMNLIMIPLIYFRYLDHAAHLGGAAFGAGYYYFGPANWEEIRRKMYEWWPTAQTGGRGEIRSDRE